MKNTTDNAERLAATCGSVRALDSMADVAGGRRLLLMWVPSWASRWKKVHGAACMGRLWIQWTPDKHGIEDCNNRAENLWKTIKWMMEQFDRVHHALVKDGYGTWQDRVMQSVEAAESISQNSWIINKSVGF